MPAQKVEGGSTPKDPQSLDNLFGGAYESPGEAKAAELVAGKKDEASAAPEAAEGASTEGTEPATSDQPEAQLQGEADGQFAEQEAAEAAPPAPPPAADPAAPPPWVESLIRQQAQQHQQATTLFQRELAASRQREAEANDRLVQIFQGAENRRLAAAREQERPRHPGLDAPPEVIEAYIQKAVEFGASQQFASLKGETSKYVSQLQKDVETIKQQALQQQQAAQAEQTMQWVQGTMDTLKRTPGFEYLNDPVKQDIFLDRWYAANARSPKGYADPRVIANELRPVLGAAGPRTQQDAKNQLSQRARARQTATGAPSVLRPGAAMSQSGKSAEEITRSVLRSMSSTPMIEVG